jgi:hypothetical protein
MSTQIDAQLDHLIHFLTLINEPVFQQPIISLGQDGNGNEHEIMLNADGTITDLYNERQVAPGTPLHLYYSSKFASK